MSHTYNSVMAQWDDIVLNQMNLYEKIRSAFDQHNRNQEVSTIDGIEASLFLLDSNYSKYQDNHARLLEVGDQEIVVNKYFKDEAFSMDNMEETYISQYGFFLEKKRILKLNSSSEQPATFTESKTFLQDRLQTLSAIESNTSCGSFCNNIQGRKPNFSNNLNIHQNIPYKSFHNSSISIDSDHKSYNSKFKPKSFKCLNCQKDHILAFCDDFRDKTAKERFEFVNTKSLCLNCLDKHPITQCRCLKTCNICHLQHHSLLHKVFAQTNLELQSQPNVLSTGQGAASIAPSLVSHSITLSNLVLQNAFVLLGTAIVEDISSNGHVSQVRALPDPCAEAAFASESVTQRLGLQKSSYDFNVTAVADLLVNDMVINRLSVRSCINSNYIYNTEAVIVANISSYVPKCSSFNSSCLYNSGIEFADPRFFSDSRIEMILSSRIYTSILEKGLRKGIFSKPLAQNSTTGWTFYCFMSEIYNVHSQSSTQHLSKNCHIYNLSYFRLSKSQELESVPVPNKSKVVSVKSPNLSQLLFVNCLSAIKSNVMSVKYLNLSQLSFQKSLSAIKSIVTPVKGLNLNQLLLAIRLFAVKPSVMSVKRLNLIQLFYVNSLFAVKSNVISVKRVYLSQLNFVNSLFSAKSNLKSKHYHVPRHGISYVNDLLCQDFVNISSKFSRETAGPLMAGGNPLREPISINFNIVKSNIFSINSCHEFYNSLFCNEHKPQVSRPVKILIYYILLNLYYVYVHSSHSRMSRNRSQIKTFNRTLNSQSQHQSSPKPLLSLISTTSVIFGQGTSRRRWFHRKFIAKRRFLIKEDIKAPTQWSLSCVIELHAGADCQIRTV